MDEGASPNPAIVSAIALPAAPLRAVVARIVVVFRVAVRLDESSVALRPGLTCDAEILAQEKRDVVTAPLASVVLRRRAAGEPETPGIFVVRDSRAVFTPVITGIIGGLDVELTGVAAGTALVTGPITVLRTLQDGASIRTQ